MSTRPAPALTPSASDHVDPVHLVPVRSLQLGGLIGAKVPALCGAYISARIGDTGESSPAATASRARGQVCPTCDLLARALPTGGQR